MFVFPLRLALVLFLLMLVPGCVNKDDEPYWQPPARVHEAEIIPFVVSVINPLNRSPLVGARVLVQSDPLYWAAEHMVTDPHGRVMVGVLQGRDLAVEVFAEGFHPWKTVVRKQHGLPEELLVEPLPRVEADSAW